MARWITFDQQTSSLLRSKLAQGTTIQTFGRGAIDYALAKPGPVVTLLPAASGGPDIGIAVFRRPGKARPTNVWTAHVSANTRAGGFLGLSDEPIFEDEPAQEQKKGWWRRFWDE
jgi:hypothetical protein